MGKPGRDNSTRYNRRMKRRTRSKPELTKAEARYRELVYELKLLTLAFPHFKDAYDSEDLPIPFLLKRGAARARNRAKKAKAAKSRKTVKAVKRVKPKK